MSLETLKERFEKVNKIRISNYGRIDKAVFDIEDIGELLSSYENLKEIEQSHKEENGKLRVEMGQLEQKIEEYRIGWCNTGEELEQYKLLDANIKKANKIIKENEFDKGLYGLLMREKEKNKELLKEYNKKLQIDWEDAISKDKIKDMMKYREFELQQEYKEFEEDVEWRTYKKILEV